MFKDVGRMGGYSMFSVKPVSTPNLSTPASQKPQLKTINTFPGVRVSNRCSPFDSGLTADYRALCEC